jgi:hypothetical protein
MPNRYGYSPALSDVCRLQLATCLPEVGRQQSAVVIRIDRVPRSSGEQPLPRCLN